MKTIKRSLSFGKKDRSASSVSSSDVAQSDYSRSLDLATPGVEAAPSAVKPLNRAIASAQPASAASPRGTPAASPRGTDALAAARAAQLAQAQKIAAMRSPRSGGAQPSPRGGGMQPSPRGGVAPAASPRGGSGGPASGDPLAAARAAQIAQARAIAMARGGTPGAPSPRGTPNMAQAMAAGGDGYGGGGGNDSPTIPRLQLEGSQQKISPPAGSAAGSARGAGGSGGASARSGRRPSVPESMGGASAAAAAAQVAAAMKRSGPAAMGSGAAAGRLGVNRPQLDGGMGHLGGGGGGGSPGGRRRGLSSAPEGGAYGARLRRGSVLAPPGRQSQRTSAAGGGAALAERVKSGQATVSHGVPELPPDFLSLGTESWLDFARTALLPGVEPVFDPSASHFGAVGGMTSGVPLSARLALGPADVMPSARGKSSPFGGGFRADGATAAQILEKLDAAQASHHVPTHAARSAETRELHVLLENIKELAIHWGASSGVLAEGGNAMGVLRAFVANVWKDTRRLSVPEGRLLLSEMFVARACPTMAITRPSHPHHH